MDFGFDGGRHRCGAHRPCSPGVSSCGLRRAGPGRLRAGDRGPLIVMNGGLPSRGRAGDVHDWGPPPHRPVHNTVLPSVILLPYALRVTPHLPFCVYLLTIL